MTPRARCSKSCRYWSIRRQSKGPPLDLDEVAVLDPACGSGHFLLGCYDLLERAWELEGVPPAESAPAIVSSLWGVDIDPRCAQVAVGGNRAASASSLSRPGAASAKHRDRPQPAGRLGRASDGYRADRATTAPRRADQRGPGGRTACSVRLLKAEDALEQEVRHAAFDGDAGTLPLTRRRFRRGRGRADGPPSGGRRPSLFVRRRTTAGRGGRRRLAVRRG